jgi:hypothetical protein
MAIHNERITTRWKVFVSRLGRRHGHSLRAFVGRRWSATSFLFGIY